MTRVLRALNLEIGQGTERVNICSTTSFHLDHAAIWLAYMLGGQNNGLVFYLLKWFTYNLSLCAGLLNLFKDITVAFDLLYYYISSLSPSAEKITSLFKTKVYLKSFFFKPKFIYYFVISESRITSPVFFVRWNRIFILLIMAIIPLQYFIFCWDWWILFAVDYTRSDTKSPAAIHRFFSLAC